MTNTSVSGQTLNTDDQVVKISKEQVQVLTSQVNRDLSDPNLTNGEKVHSIENVLSRLRSSQAYPLEQAQLIVQKFEITGKPYGWRTSLSLADQFYIAGEHSTAHKFYKIFHLKSPHIDKMKYQDSRRLNSRQRGTGVLNAMIKSAIEVGDVTAWRNLTELSLSQNKYNRAKRYKSPRQTIKARVLRDLITQSITLNDKAAINDWTTQLHETLSGPTEDYFFQPLSEDKFYNEIKEILTSSGHTQLADKIYSIPRRNDATELKQKLVKLDGQCRKNKKQACAEIAEIYAYELEFREQAFVANKRACELNYAQGCYYTGRKLHEGVGIKRDINTARDLLKKACHLKDASGCGQYGLILKYHGVNGSPDKKTAKQMFKKACRLEPDITYCIDAKYLK